MVSLASGSDWLLLVIILMNLRVERHYISRPSILANTVSILIASLHHWDNLFWVFQWWAGIGFFIFGIVAFISYLAGGSMTADFYDIAWFGYNTPFATLYVLYTGFLS